MSELMHVRLYDYHGDGKRAIKVCEHVQIDGYEDPMPEEGNQYLSEYSCEYIEQMNLHCVVCDKDYQINIKVN